MSKRLQAFYAGLWTAVRLKRRGPPACMLVSYMTLAAYLRTAAYALQALNKRASEDVLDHRHRCETKECLCCARKQYTDAS